MHGFIRSLAADPVIDRGHHQIISLWLINYPALRSTTYAIDRLSPIYLNLTDVYSLMHQLL